MSFSGNSPIEDLMTLSEAAKKLRVSIRQVYRIIADGKIPVLMVGKRSPRVRPSDLQQYLQSCTVQPSV